MSIRGIRASSRTSKRWLVVALAAVIGLFALQSPAGTSTSREVSKKPVLNQEGGDPIDDAGTTVTRSENGWLRASVSMPTPAPGTYNYPDPSTAIPGDPTHPPAEPGDPEVFTFWMFHFQYPELCTDGGGDEGTGCGPDDLGDAPAQGGVYWLDNFIADGDWIHMDAIIAAGQEATAFNPIIDPTTTEVHLAVAPHGAARMDPAELAVQLNHAIGTATENWFFGGTHITGEDTAPTSGAPTSGS